MSPGGIALGAIIGLAAGVVGSVPLLAAGLVDTETLSGQAVLILIGFGAQFLAGFAGARLSPTDPALNGGLAALLLYVVAAGIAIAAGRDPGVPTLAFSAAVALVMGSAGGVLAAARRR